MSNKASEPANWQEVKKEIESAIDKIWIVEPDEIKKIRWGVIESGAGTGKQSFSILVHLEAYLMIIGADVMFRFLKIAQYDDVELPALVRLTKEFLSATFNVFEFMGDLGLPNMHHAGERYIAALDTVRTKEEYISLTSSMYTYVVRTHRWIHLIFPWNLGVAFPHRLPAEVADIEKVLRPSLAK